jgi:hypothetical protein
MLSSENICANDRPRALPSVSIRSAQSSSDPVVIEAIPSVAEYRARLTTGAALLGNFVTRRKMLI